MTDVVFRNPESGQGPILSDNDQDVWTFDAATGTWGGRPVPAPPVASGVGVEAHASAESANLFPTSGTVNYRASTGVAFAETLGHADWTLTPGGCLYTYNGAAARYLAILTASVNPTANAFIYHELNLGIDHNGDLIGSSCAANVTPGCNCLFWPAGDQQFKTMVSQRVLALAPGDTVQPCGGVETTGPNTNVDIIRLTLCLVKV